MLEDCMIVDIHDDFNLFKIANSGQCFRAIEVKEGIYRFIVGDNLIYMKSHEINPSNDLITKLDISVDEGEWNNVWYNYFDFDTSYVDIRNSIKDDDYLLNAAGFGKGIRILNQEPFEMLISFIISQRKSIPAIMTSVERICKLYGKKIKTEYETVYTFPDADTLANAKGLDTCGLGYRLPYVLGAAKDVASGLLDLKELYSYDDEELFNELKKVKGVGDKVANCICLFAYHRVARAPKDVWINRVIEEEYSGIDPFPKYDKYAGIMQQYMFYAAKNSSARLNSTLNMKGKI